MGPFDILLLIVIGLILGGAVFGFVKTRKKGGCSCSSCASCGSCPSCARRDPKGPVNAEKGN